MPRYLFIVTREEPELWAHLKREFVNEEGVVVMLDRRRTDRRRSGATWGGTERRRLDRRVHPSIRHELNTLNFALVRAD
ncbi:MAG TPA: hypothetical protein VFX14_23570 [Methylomirabilota bacterium]|nr:hypothetical protein [Methylomirabilota bacterium]